MTKIIQTNNLSQLYGQSIQLTITDRIIQDYNNVNKCSNMRIIQMITKQILTLCERIHCSKFVSSM